MSKSCDEPKAVAANDPPTEQPADPAVRPRHSAGVVGLWRHLPVQIKFFTIAIALIILSVTGAFFLIQKDFHDSEQAALTNTQRNVTFSHALLLAEPLRAGDIQTAKRLMTTIIATPAFVGAALTDQDRTIVAVGEDLASADPAHLHVEPIIYSDEHDIYEIGQLVTLTSDALIHQAVWDQCERYLITMATLVLSLGCAVVIAYHYTIGKPLTAIVKVIDTARDDRRPICIPSGSEDEIGRLAKTFDRYVQREWTYKRDLVEANTLLEERVAQRTHELSEALEDAKRARDAAAQIAQEDGLTGLLNRRAFADDLSETLTRQRRRDDRLAVMLIDLDRFKTVNDTHGHGVGDRLLCAVADRLQRLLGGKGTVARLGGDEFAVFIKGVANLEAITEIARDIIALLNRSLAINEKTLHPGASMGIAVYPRDGDSHEALIANADIALYRAKDAGRGRFCFFDADMRAHVDRSDRIATALRGALEKNELQLAYQPKIDLLSHRLIGFEALLRWRHDALGQVPPEEFLAVAEDRGMILSIGRLVIDQATADLGQWLALGFDPGTIAINIHPVELRRRDHMADMLGKIRATGLDVDRFVLEVTENCVIGRGNEEAVDVLCELSRQGFALSLDDFGTGYASLKHLKELPLNEIKIDKSFTADIVRDPSTAAIVHATLELARDLDIGVIAEGIEHQDQIDHLKALGHIIGQGYAFSHPMNAADVEIWMGQGGPFASLDQHAEIPSGTFSEQPKDIAKGVA